MFMCMLFLDGRDVQPGSALEYIADLEEYMNEIGLGKIATVSGRYYAMDRDKRWERVKLAYDAMVLSKGEENTSAIEAVKRAFHDNKTDEFVLPTVIMENNKPVAAISNKDSVIFFNFRPDRAREITRAINDKVFLGFERETLNLNYVCTTQYDMSLENVDVAYTSESLH